MQYSDYIIYVDESGDHGLVSIDPQHPVFVLVFCIFEKKVYANDIVPRFHTLKYDFWGHDMVILHSHHIRKPRDSFVILQKEEVRVSFLSRLEKEMDDSAFTVIATVINKIKHKQRYTTPFNPYNIALQFCVERARRFLDLKGVGDKLTHVVMEKRGIKEDKELELEFRRNMHEGESHLLLEPIFADKKENSIGLQIADLVAHPIGRHVMDSKQPNRAYEIVEKKFHKNESGKTKGCGLKIFP
jgi:hypothetical protein